MALYRLRQVVELGDLRVPPGDVRAVWGPFPGQKGLQKASRTPFSTQIDADLHSVTAWETSIGARRCTCWPTGWPKGDLTGVYEACLTIKGTFSGVIMCEIALDDTSLKRFLALYGPTLSSTTSFGALRTPGRVGGGVMWGYFGLPGGCFGGLRPISSPPTPSFDRFGGYVAPDQLLEPLRKDELPSSTTQSSHGTPAFTP